MDDVMCTTKSVGVTNRSRQLAGAGALLVGAAGCALATVVDWPLYQTLIILGGAATLAWLISGSSRRFMGPGLAATAVGVGITLYRSLDMEPVAGEHTVLYPMLGVALIVASIFNPMAIRGAGAFLLIVGAVAFIDTPWNPGWTLAGALVSWGVLDLVRISRMGDDSLDSPDSVDLRTSDDRPEMVGARQ